MFNSKIISNVTSKRTIGKCSVLRVSNLWFACSYILFSSIKWWPLVGVNNWWLRASSLETCHSVKSNHRWRTIQVRFYSICKWFWYCRKIRILVFVYLKYNIRVNYVKYCTKYWFLHIFPWTLHFKQAQMYQIWDMMKKVKNVSQ